MKITGMLAIGNGEKCPFCDMIIDKDTDIFFHMRNNHKEEMVKALFETEDDK